MLTFYFAIVNFAENLNLKSYIVSKPGGYVNVERRESLRKG